MLITKALPHEVQRVKKHQEGLSPSESQKPFPQPNQAVFLPNPNQTVLLHQTCF